MLGDAYRAQQWFTKLMSTMQPTRLFLEHWLAPRLNVTVPAAMRQDQSVEIRSAARMTLFTPYEIIRLGCNVKLMYMLCPRGRTTGSDGPEKCMRRLQPNMLQKIFSLDITKIRKAKRRSKNFPINSFTLKQIQCQRRAGFDSVPVWTGSKLCAVVAEICVE